MTYTLAVTTGYYYLTGNALPLRYKVKLCHLKPGTSVRCVQWTGSNSSVISEFLGNSRFHSDKDNNLIFSDPLSGARTPTIASLNGWLVEAVDHIAVFVDSAFGLDYLVE